MADLMLARWTGETYQFEPPRLALRCHAVAADQDLSDHPHHVLVVSVVVGVALWLFLTRTRIGMMMPRRCR